MCDAVHRTDGRSREGDDLTAANGGQCPVGRQVDGVADEADRPVGQGEVQAAAVPTAEGGGVLPLPGVVVVGRVLDVRGNGAGRGRGVGVGPGEPVGVLWQAFPDQEGAARAVGDGEEAFRRLPIDAVEDAIALVEAVPAPVGTWVAPLRVAPAPVGPADSL